MKIEALLSSANIEALGLQNLKLNSERYLLKARQASLNPKLAGQSLRNSKDLSAIVAARLIEICGEQNLRKAGAVQIGSQARGELCLKSDLDLLFIGDPAAAAEISAKLAEMGLSSGVRYLETEGAASLPFKDQLALLDAQPYFEATELTELILRMRADLFRQRKSMLAQLNQERKDRSQRFDSVSGVLEPNIKLGIGGLRDLNQARMVRRLFAEKFDVSDHAEIIYTTYLDFFLAIRQRLHAGVGGNDTLSAYEQSRLANELGFLNPREFMREVQLGLARVAFYADVDFERARKAKSSVPLKKDSSFSERVQKLARDPGLLNQWYLREGPLPHKFQDESLIQCLKQALFKEKTDELLVAMFRSRMMEHLMTGFVDIIGYVQHDQYHRFTVDAHLMQAGREALRAKRRPSILGRFKKTAHELSAKDWEILTWAALYHDIGKGDAALSELKHSEHSDRSYEILLKDLNRFGVAEDVIEDVAWLVKNHLVLSQAAFKSSGQNPQIWKELFDLGVSGVKLKRLAIFTLIDIRATNREAHTPWKERLLFDLMTSMQKPEAVSMNELAHAVKEIEGEQSPLLDIVPKLDPFLLANVSPRLIAKDLILIVEKPQENNINTFWDPKHRKYWVRYFSPVDASGIFFKLASVLLGAGLSVRHASINSLPGFGVYDWIEVKPPRERKRLPLRLSDAYRKIDQDIKLPRWQKRFEHIDLVHASQQEWIIEFKGKDFRGALLFALYLLSQAGPVSIKWARVHTWGLQIDDIFGIEPLAQISPVEFLERLQRVQKDFEL